MLMPGMEDVIIPDEFWIKLAEQLVNQPELLEFEAKIKASRKLP